LDSSSDSGSARHGVDSEFDDGNEDGNEDLDDNELDELAKQFLDSDEETAELESAAQSYSRQIMQLVTGGHVTQTGAAAMLKINKQYAARVWPDDVASAALPGSYHMLKKLADADTGFLKETYNDSFLVDLCPQDHCAYYSTLADAQQCPQCGEARY
jgi:hypothetical protein